MRRFQFSLRTLLIVVTLLAIPCGWLGWQAKIVRDRKATWARISKSGGHDSALWSLTTSQREPDRRGTGYPKTVSWIRRLLGDRPVNGIILPDTLPPDDVEQILKIFPEAEMWYWHPVAEKD